MSAPKKPGPFRAVGLILRAGVFYALLSNPAAGEAMEVALHGAANLNQAMQAVQTLTGDEDIESAE